MIGQNKPQRVPTASRPGTEAPDFTDKEVERRALDTARRVLATPKKPAEPKAPRQPPVVTGGKKPDR
jgi:hypothetical protein